MKKLLALLLIVAMITPLVACGPKGPTEYTKLNCIFLGTPPTNEDLALVEEEMNKIAREKIGAELDITFLDAGSMGEKLNVMMGSGEQIDVVWTGYAFKYAQCVSNGGLYDITELIEQTPAIKEHIPDYALNQCYIDGKLYGVPNMQIMASYYNFVFPKALVEKYNFDYTKVQKLEDLEPYLDALVKNEPNIYPIADANMMGSWVDREFKANYFEPVDNVVINAQTGEITFPVDTPKYVERWQRAKDWYSKGYIRKDILTVSDYEQDKLAGKVGVWAVSGKPGQEASLSNKYGYEVVVQPSCNPVLGNPTSTMMCVGANTVDPLKSLQVIELLNDNVEFHNLAVFGIEGTHYNRDENGKVKMVENAGYNQTSFSWALGDQFITYLQSHEADNLWEVTKEMNDTAKPAPNAGFALPTAIKDVLKNEIALLCAIGGEYAKGLRFGTMDLNKVLPEYKERAQDLFDEIKAKIAPYVKEWMDGKK